MTEEQTPLPGLRPRMRPGETTAAVLAGEDDLSTWDIEELMAGRRRNKNGTFSGAHPKLVAAPILKELARRIRSEEEMLLILGGLRALQVLEEIMTDANQDGSARVKAATVLLERARGKVVQGLAVMQPPQPLPRIEQIARGVVVTTAHADDEPLPTVARGMVISDRSGFAEDDGDG